MSAIAPSTATFSTPLPAMKRTMLPESALPVTGRECAFVGEVPKALLRRFE